MHSESVPEGPLGPFREAFSRIDQGRLRSPRSDVQVGIDARRKGRLDVYSHQTLARAAGVPLTRLPWYNDVLVPVGVTHAGGMVVSLPVGEAWLSVAHSRPASDRFGEENRLDLLRFQLPAFKAGVSAVADANRGHRALADAFDAHEQGCIARRLDGRELFRKDCFERLLEHEPERDRLLAVANEMARSLIRMRRRASKTNESSIAPPAFRRIEAVRASHEMRATFVAAGVLDRDAVVIVMLEQTGGVDDRHAAVITARSLDLGLTPREADVLRCLAQGLRYAAVARELGISHDTVRTHIRHLYRKLGVHSLAEAVSRVLAERVV